MRQYAQDDYGYYAVNFFDDLGDPANPDFNATLYFEFRDADGVLQFTATTVSTPALQAGAGFVYVENIPLTGWAVGVAQVRVYAQLAGVDFEPSPLVASAFEIVDAGTLVAQLRRVLRIDDTSEDDDLLELIQAAADYAEKYLARTLITKDRTKQVQAPMGRGLSHSFLKWPKVLLTYPPVISVDSVCTVDEQGNETLVSSSDYWLDTYQEPPELHLKSSAWSYLLRVDYSAGYGTTYLDLPDSIRRGILKHAAYLYKYRGDCDAGEAATKSGAVGEYRIYKVVRRG